MNEIFIAPNKNCGGIVDTSNYSFAATEQIRRLHKSLKNYSVTPLIELKNFAREKNLAAVFVKDESKRFGLKAFKALGGVWAIYKVISRELGLENPTLEEIFQRRDELSEMTFITTTDGNHGKGVSWSAGLFGCKSFVYMPKNTVEIRARAIRDAYYIGNAQINDAASCAQALTKLDATSRCRDAGSATVEITDMNYDDCVKFTAQLAEKNHWHLIQDTSWNGYEEIPAQIMLGYSTLAYEALEQMNHACPTHIFLQAGVGSMAGAIAAVFAENFPDNPPRVTIVEPTQVACFYESFKIGDGKIHSATGNGQTMMAGLNCATPCEIAWKILRRHAADAVAISDDVAAEGMRRLANPFGDDEKIISGESGCAGFALLNAVVDNPKLRKALEIDEHSKIFVINTEGDTDPVNYEKILREEAYS
ncbi:MAG: diaminopropionate ammonia-lyase [Selenomonadaceae bacterium]|nr:diaminopropionate ammonia-lyase [Selenomonadaceae bacterium]